MSSLIFLLTSIIALPQASPQTESAALRLIVVRTEPEANALLARLQAGEKFEVLAKAQSIDRTAAAGGYLGTFAISQLRAEFQAALNGLRPGQFSSVIRLGREFALIQRLSVEEASSIEM